MTERDQTINDKGNKPDTLCLDFANTAEWHASAQPDEKLNCYEDLAKWAEEHGILGSDEAENLQRKTLQNRETAGKALSEAIELREAIYRIFSRHAGGQTAAYNDLDLLNQYLSRAMSFHLIEWNGSDFVWRWADMGESFERLLWPIAFSTAKLLTSPWLERVGQCADESGCGWLFLDESRNHNRRWCNMQYCGNRAKARRHYKRSAKKA